MIAHVVGHLCATDMALALGIDVAAVHRRASRQRWRKVKRPGHREVYYNADDAGVSLASMLDKDPTGRSTADARDG